jgi:DNA repair protein RecN (Recombination protein N)
MAPTTTVARLAERVRTLSAAAQRREQLEFQHGELSDAGVRVGEEAELRQERELLRHAERVQEVCRGGEATLYSGENATVATLARLVAQVGELATVAPPLASAAELIETGRVQLEEAALQLRSAAERFHADADRLEAVELRLQMLGRWPATASRRTSRRRVARRGEQLAASI